MNRVELSATAHAVQPLRHTPAGVPVLELLLDHASDVLEAGHMRHVRVQVTALAMGDMARLLADTPPGTGLQLQGFLAAQRKGSGKLVLHIQQAERFDDQVQSV